jgi:heavy metal translocating P-type ATPase
VRIAFAAVVAAQSMIFSLAVNLSPPSGATRLWLHGALAASAVGVFALVGGPLLRAALVPRVAFEQLFLLGICGAFFASLVSTLTGVGHVYYEVVAILLAIHTFGRTLGERRRAAALDAARALGAEFATCERVAPDGTLLTVPVKEIRRDDLVAVIAGGNIPVDGVVAEGVALVDEATLTGEPFPVVRRAGDPVLAGSRLLDGPLRVRATVDGGDRLLDALFARVREAQSRPGRLQREADRLVAWFLPAVVAIAIGSFAAWTAHAGWTVGLFNALAVILVACPCSMGLATPVGVWSALADLARHGVVAGTSDLVERLAAVRQVVFDKTGTLGDEQMELVDFVSAPGVDREALLAEVAALEAASDHPIARAFRRSAPAGAAREVRNLPGVGVEGRVGEVRLSVGNSSLLPRDLSRPADELRAQLRAAGPTTPEIYVVRDGALGGIAVLRERLREASRSVLAELEAAGLPCTVLTGDRSSSAAAHGLANVEAGLSPVEKAARVREISAVGRVLFVGDGVNDAPAMAEASASLAIATGSPLARETAMGELRDLRAIPAAIARSRAAVRTIRRNLRFAAAYNGIGITLAAAGILHPVAAALLMLASSFTVTTLALRPAAARDVRLTPRRRPAPLAAIPSPEPA